MILEEAKHSGIEVLHPQMGAIPILEAAVPHHHEAEVVVMAIRHPAVTAAAGVVKNNG